MKPNDHFQRMATLMTVGGYLVIAWVIAWITVTAQGTPATAFLHVNVIDGTGAPLKTDQTVVVANGRILSIGGAADVPVSDTTRQVDGTGKYLIPGLWDAHVHTRPEGIDHLRLSIVNGVTSIRDMGGPWEHLERIKQWRRDISAGALIGPRVIAAGPILDGSGARFFLINKQIVRTPQEGREQVRRLKAAGADFVKAYDLLSAETFAAIADEATAQGLPISGHLPFAVSPADVSDAGYRTLEHATRLVIPLSSEGDAVSAEIRSAVPEQAVAIMQAAQDRLLRSVDVNRVRALAAVFRRNGTYVVPVLSNGWSAMAESRRDGRLGARMRFTPPAYRAIYNGAGLGDAFAAIWWQVVDLVRVLHQEGVQLIAGTDVTAGNHIIGFSLHNELTLLVRAGLSPMEAIEAATRKPSRLFGFSDLGTIEAGMQADLVLLDANPLANIENTTRIAAVMAGGRLFDRDALQRMLKEIEQEAARWSGTVTRPK